MTSSEAARRVDANRSIKERNSALSNFTNETQSEKKQEESSNKKTDNHKSGWCERKKYESYVTVKLLLNNSVR